MVKKKVKKTKEYLFKHHKECENHSGHAIYGLGFIGAAIYYISNATSFLMGVFGILKAIVWPAYLVYGLLKYLGI